VLDNAEVDTLIAAAIAEGPKRYPGVSLKEAALREHLVRLDGRAMPAYATELYLAAACAEGDREAIRWLTQWVSDLAPAALKRFNWDAARREDLLQSVAEKLLVDHPDRPARIRSYTGSGSFEGWLRVVLTSAARDLHAKEQHIPGSRPSDDAVIDALANRLDPQMQAIRDQFRSNFREAFRAAFSRLPPRDRTVLRLHAIDGLSIDKIAAMYQTHRATAARWVARARDVIGHETRAELARKLRLQLGGPELESLMREVNASLDVTLTSLLRD
jgi:RNA polymerase sigma-70 factor (ECF subfamily)